MLEKFLQEMYREDIKEASKAPPINVNKRLAAKGQAAVVVAPVVSAFSQ